MIGTREQIAPVKTPRKPGRKMAENRPSGFIRDYAETAEICQSSRLFRENSSRFATVTGGGA